MSSSSLQLDLVLGKALNPKLTMEIALDFPPGAWVRGPQWFKEDRKLSLIRISPKMFHCERARLDTLKNETHSPAVDHAVPCRSLQRLSWNPNPKSQDIY